MPAQLPIAVAERIQASAHTVLQYHLTPAENLPQTASRVGGVGYWPRHLDYPRNARGQALALLAQFNLAELPRHPDLPERGILAFYIDVMHEGYGMDFDDPAQNSARCVYFADSSAPSLSREEQLDLLPPELRELW